MTTKTTRTSTRIGAGIAAAAAALALGAGTAAADTDTPESVPVPDGSYTLHAYSPSLTPVAPTAASVPATVVGGRLIVSGVAVPGAVLSGFAYDDGFEGAVVTVGTATVGQIRAR